MSSFTCEKCGVAIIDSPRGYATGCKHHPMARVTRVQGDTITHRLPDGRVNTIVCGEPLRAWVVAA